VPQVTIASRLTVISGRNASYESTIDKIRLATWQETLIQLLTRCAPAIVIWIGALMIIRGTVTLGTMVAFFAHLGFLYLPLERFAQLSAVHRGVTSLNQRNREGLGIGLLLKRRRTASGGRRHGRQLPTGGRPMHPPPGGQRARLRAAPPRAANSPPALFAGLSRPPSLQRFNPEPGDALKLSHPRLG